LQYCGKAAEPSDTPISAGQSTFQRRFRNHTRPALGRRSIMCRLRGPVAPAPMLFLPTIGAPPFDPF
jgi:hypothetical protein